MNTWWTKAKPPGAHFTCKFKACSVSKLWLHSWHLKTLSSRGHSGRFMTFQSNARIFASVTDHRCPRYSRFYNIDNITTYMTYSTLSTYSTQSMIIDSTYSTLSSDFILILTLFVFTDFVGPGSRTAVASHGFADLGVSGTLEPGEIITSRNVKEHHRTLRLPGL